MITAIHSVSLEWPGHTQSPRDLFIGGDGAVIAISVAATGAPGDPVYLAMWQRRSGRLVARRVATLSVGGGATGVATAQINIATDCDDADGTYRATMGTYLITASSRPHRQGVVANSSLFLCYGGWGYQVLRDAA